MEQSVYQLNSKLESMKIEAYRIGCQTMEVPVSKNASTRPEQQMHLFQNCESQSISSEVIGNAARLCGPKDEYPEPMYIATPNEFVSPNGTFFTGPPAPVLNLHGYTPYLMEGVPHHSSVVEYSYVNQPICGSVTPEMQYPAHLCNGYVYGPEIYHYQPQPYYQHAPSGQFVVAQPSLSAGDVILFGAQDPVQPGAVVSNGFTNIDAYAGLMPGFPMTMVLPPVPCEEGVIPVANAVPPSHTLRASAPVWVAPSIKLNGLQNQGNPVQVQPKPSQPYASVLPNESISLIHSDANRIVPKSCPGPSGDSGATASCSLIGTPDAVVLSGTIAKDKSLDDDDKQQMKGIESVKQCVSLGTFDEQSKDVRVSRERIFNNLKVPFGGPNKDSGKCLPNGEQYNVADFATKYHNAKHFVIKSYSEDNVHKSIQYGVWASTPNGNRKLDAAYQDAQRRAGGKACACPVFLFFSVNGSRQFCGVAEMVGPVDYRRSMEFWEQNKWSGSFPVKWHIIKDVPNSQLRRIILGNNENKPVTNSRDTQEINFQQGLEMLSIFKCYPARTSMLDEFTINATPQKTMEDVEPQQWCSKSFSTDEEQNSKEHDEGVGLKTAKLNCNILKTLDNGLTPKVANCQQKMDMKSVLRNASGTSGQGISVDQIAKGRDSADGHNTAKSNFTLLNNNGPKLKEGGQEINDIKPVLGVQDSRVDKEKAKLQKENVKIPGKEERRKTVV